MGVRSALRAGVICVCLGGCSATGMGGNTPATYQIIPPDTRALRLTHWPVNLAVHMPGASRAIDTDRILVTKGERTTYLAEVAWSDRLPRLLHSCMSTALKDSGGFRAVLSAQDRLDSDYALSADISSFQIEVGEGKVTATVTLVARLVDGKTGKVLAIKEFSALVPVTADDPDSGVAALQKAFSQVAIDMVRWTSSQRGRKVASN